MVSRQETEALHHAIDLATELAGATSPNPPVGAAALDAEGRLLACAVHRRAGTAHAEARLLETLEREGTVSRLHTVVVTLEPCNHVRAERVRCSEQLLNAGVRRVVIGALDPNPTAAGGSARLREQGVEVELFDGHEAARARELIAPFAHWVRTGMPYVTVKVARDERGSMVPPPGQKTFTSPAALKLAHELRRRCDAILTGSGTVLADLPEFTVRHIPDHEGKRRWLVVLDRRRRIPREWVEQATRNGFQVVEGLELPEALEFLGKQGVLEVLVEAGPTLSAEILRGGFWNRHVVISVSPSGGENVHWNYR